MGPVSSTGQSLAAAGGGGGGNALTGAGGVVQITHLCALEPEGFGTFSASYWRRMTDLHTMSCPNVSHQVRFRTCYKLYLQLKCHQSFSSKSMNCKFLLDFGSKISICNLCKPNS